MQGTPLTQGPCCGRKYRAVIDRSYPLEGVVEAHRYVDTQQRTCNVVVIGPRPGGTELHTQSASASARTAS